MSQEPPQIPGYDVLHELGAGGMATVYLANQLSLERKVAIKVLRGASPEPGTAGDRAEKRFLREAQMLARLSHINVCGIYDVAKAGEIPYIAMEYIDGGTLGDRLRRGMTAAEAISAVVQLASALSTVHAIGIVHRDLKPENVMMRGKVPVLTDFGIARDASLDRTELTGDHILGTATYMSPEQINGQPIDPRSDVYSLGAILFELLTGRPPYQGDSPMVVCVQHLQAPIPSLPPPLCDLQPVIEGMLTKDRNFRFPDMTSVVSALRATLLESAALRTELRFTSDRPWNEQLRDLGFSFEGLGAGALREAANRAPSAEPAAPDSPSPSDPKFPRRRTFDRGRLVGGLALTGALALAAVVLWRGLGDPRESAEPAQQAATDAASFDRRPEDLPGSGRSTTTPGSPEAEIGDGRLVLDAAPWGRLVSIVAADGKAAPVLGQDRTTPLLLTLPEGHYRLTVVGPDGLTQRETDAIVTRGQLSVAALSFSAIDTDTYLKQAGFK